MSVTRLASVRTAVRLTVRTGVVVTALGVVAAGSPAVSTTSSPPTGGPTALLSSAPAIADVELIPDSGSPVSAATVPLGTTAAKLGRSARSVGAAPVNTGELSTSTYKMVAVTWKSGDPLVAVRFHNDQGWSGWRPLEHLTDGPTANSDEARASATQGTELLWVGASDGVQVRSSAATELALQLIDPGTVPEDSTAAPASRTAATAATKTQSRSQSKTVARASAKVRARTTSPTGAPRPVKLKFRHDWNADPKLRNGKPTYTGSIKQVHLHHTASGNGYAQADVPGILRGIYRYHTQNLGWFDVGYNFLVDRFGQSWVGRSGKARRRVQGAHTLGFNHKSVGIAVLGDYQVLEPTKKMVRAIAQLAAWKLGKEGRHAVGGTWMKSKGSNRFPPGQRVRLPKMDGHVDTNKTACPGNGAYLKLPMIREKTERRINRYK